MNSKRTIQIIAVCGMLIIPGCPWFGRPTLPPSNTGDTPADTTPNYNPPDEERPARPVPDENRPIPPRNRTPKG